MMRAFEFRGMSTGYHELGKAVLEYGDLVSPRGQQTREIRDAIFTIWHPLDSLPMRCGRKLNTTIAAIEAIQLIGGVSRPELNVGASPNFKQFLEDDGAFWAPYGLRAASQPHHLIRKLTHDRDSRQAVMTFWDHRKDNVEGRRDFPCTVALTFSIRHDQLELSVLMRSSDFWWGIPYDVFQFTQLQVTIARALGIEAGKYTHHSVSLHVYERDWDNVEDLTPGGIMTPINGIAPVAFDGHVHEKPWARWESAKARAQLIAYQNKTATWTPTPSEQWYIDKVTDAMDRYQAANHD